MGHQSKYIYQLSRTIRQHKLVLFSTFFLWLAGFAINHFIDPHLAFFSGEHIFSFDYLDHIGNIIRELQSKPNLLLETNICENCPYIYHYSRWHALVNFIVLAGGQLVGMNPLVYEALLSITIVMWTTYLAIYFLNNAVVRPLPYLVANVALSCMMLNFLYLGGGHYAIHMSALLIAISYALKATRKIDTISWNRAFFYGLVSGLFGFFFLNISLGFLPIYLYTMACIFGIALYKYPHHWLKIAVIFLTSLVTTVCINFPIVISIILNGNTRSFNSFTPVSTLGSFFLTLTSNVGAADSNSVSTPSILFSTCLIVLTVIGLQKYRRMFIATTLIYIACALLMQGSFIYAYLFAYAPFLNSLRSVHRLTTVQHVVVFVVLYYGFELALSHKKSSYRWMAWALASVLVVFSIGYSLSNLSSVDMRMIPNEYFQMDTKLSRLEGKKVYFPPYLPPSQGINRNFRWFISSSKNVSLYTNPFSSLFATSDLQSTERHEEGLHQMELRSLLDLRNSYEYIQKSLVTQRIRYLILDKNFMWKKNFPDFDTEKLVSPFKLVATFGNLSVYEVPLPPSTCLKSYGKFSSDYCHIEVLPQKPEHLIDVSNKDYLFRRHQPQKAERLSLVGGVQYNGVVNPALQDYLLQNKIPFFGTSTIHNEAKGRSLIYKKFLSKGEYVLVLNTIKTTQGELPFVTPNIEIATGTQKILKVTPHSPRPGIYADYVPIHMSADDWVNVYFDSNGFISMFEPYIMTRPDYEQVANGQDKIK